jgi:hypothetical protein
MTSGYANISETRGKADPWSYIRDRDVERLGEVLLDPQERARWAMAFLVAAGLPYMWQKLAPNIQDIAYALLELQPGGVMRLERRDRGSGRQDRDGGGC